jgi:hypothetical protein
MQPKCSDSHFTGLYRPSREVQVEHRVDAVEHRRTSAVETAKDQGRGSRVI